MINPVLECMKIHGSLLSANRLVERVCFFRSYRRKGYAEIALDLESEGPQMSRFEGGYDHFVRPRCEGSPERRECDKKVNTYMASLMQCARTRVSMSSGSYCNRHS